MVAQCGRDLTAGHLDPARNAHRQRSASDGDRDDDEQRARQLEQVGADEFDSGRNRATSDGAAEQAEHGQP
ncbi:Uncharacterised protein [Mycobacterium tuberculosis]|nr:Uncharacterised protein [Mycobacterium tuberculosis]